MSYEYRRPALVSAVDGTLARGEGKDNLIGSEGEDASYTLFFRFVAADGETTRDDNAVSVPGNTSVSEGLAQIATSPLLAQQWRLQTRQHHFLTSMMRRERPRYSSAGCHGGGGRDETQ